MEKKIGQMTLSIGQTTSGHARSAVLWAALLMLLMTEACSAPEREKGWRADIGFLLKEMRQQHYMASNETLAAFALRLRQFLEEKHPKTLIIDVRHNNGGNAELLQPLIDVLHGFETRHRQNRLFVMTGRNTFSAVQIFIARIDRLTHAIFAGEPSSSKSNFVGEENEVILPWSGAICSISNRYHESIPGDQREWIEPEIKVELSSHDYFANRDPVLETVLRAAGNH